MKPWPEEIAKRYPLPPAPVGGREMPYQCHDRPWWALIDMVRSPTGGAPLWTKAVARRRDGVTITQHGKDVLDAGPGLGQRKVPSKKQGGSWQAERALLMAECDEKRPIPHPGYRVGQVWGILDPNHKEPVILSIVEHSGEWYVGGSKTANSREELEAILIGRGAFLLADTVCPWLAPWAPTGEIPK